MQKAKQDAQEEWNAFLADYKRTLTTDQIGDRSETLSCNCAFRIEDVQIQTPPEHPDFTIEFLSSTECQPGNPFCYYYSSFYFSGPICGTINNPDCFDDWTGGPLPPTGDRQFHCKVPRYSTFPIGAGSLWLDNDCNFGFVDSWSITFRVVCQDGEIDACDPLGHGYVSDIFTFTGSGSAYFLTMGIQLTGCGCEPQIARS